VACFVGFETRGENYGHQTRIHRPDGAAAVRPPGYERQFKESDNVSRSLSHDSKLMAKAVVKECQDHTGGRKPANAK
jgi:hypothetical protein